MPNVSIKINASAFGKKFNNMLDSTKFKNAAFNLIYPIYDDAKSKLLQDFEEHTITQEIENGPESDNISETLQGYGNLYSFIGFDSDNENPIIPLKELLENSITIKQTVRRDKFWYFKISLPSKSEIREATPMPWEEGLSWVEGIEEGISNLSHYLYTHWEGGRSKEGIQLKGEFIPELSFVTRPYLTKFFKDFREEIKSNI